LKASNISLTDYGVDCESSATAEVAKIDAAAMVLYIMITLVSLSEFNAKVAKSDSQFTGGSLFLPILKNKIEKIKAGKARVPEPFDGQRKKRNGKRTKKNPTSRTPKKVVFIFFKLVIEYFRFQPFKSVITSHN
jgi:hypothetical protein